MKNKQSDKEKKHDLDCIKAQLKREGEKHLNQEPNAFEFVKGRGDGLLRALDLLNGEVTGDCTFIGKQNCICYSTPTGKPEGNWKSKIDKSNHTIMGVGILKTSDLIKGKPEEEWEKELIKLLEDKGFFVDFYDQKDHTVREIKGFEDSVKSFISDLLAQAKREGAEEMLEKVTKEAHKIITVWDLKDFYKFLSQLNKEEK
jgi:hypothetical protein